MSNTTIARASVSRTISSTPLRILDAPDIVDDYYLNLISWGHNNVGEPLVLHGAVVLLLILGGGEASTGVSNQPPLFLDEIRFGRWSKSKTFGEKTFFKYNFMGGAIFIYLFFINLYSMPRCHPACGH